MKAGHGGVVMGSELSGGIRNVFVENCRMSSPDLERGIRIKTNAMRGGSVENLNVRGLKVGTVRDLIVINFYYEEGEDGPFSPAVSHINIQDVRCLSAKRVLDLRGFEHAPIRDVNLSGIVVQRATMPSRVSHVEGLNFSQVIVNGVPVIRASDLSSLRL
ncbi:MAG: glycosyl hydrolase family 28 protein, partial [Xanthomonadales bacterium]|nr:glycosyl hydrolase family 28 protein [Xanthomonadales bacterium]